MKIFIGSDHAGVQLKQFLYEKLQEKGYFVEDRGVMDSYTPANYALVAHDVSNCLKNTLTPIESPSLSTAGILICGSGIGICIAANRHPHIRAALCHTPQEAQLSRLHNHANVLCLGARSIAPEIALESVLLFLTTLFEGGRHLARISALNDYE
jgi:ribose 5-phosphate isomerase B